ncbi:hypothetical protein F2Q69_00043043 [Brassica cretica]|uniref:Uncharacterized protein n=1 Tax=Brassica cretica TaxID=69181 RepID=A0A8S9ND54_BRACR|nr:hypothetical protein F2Q69_00043043 [Brassica cretica]
MTHKEFAARHSHPPIPVYVNIDRQRETADDQQPPAPIDRRTPLTYRVQLPKIDIARINALRPQPKPSANPPETASIHSEDAAESMKVDKAHMRRTLRKRKKKIKPDHYQILSVDFRFYTMHLKREANEKEMESFQKRVFRIPLEKPFDEAYFTLRFTNQKSIDNQLEESIDSSPDDWENNYYNPTLAEHSERSSPRATPHREEYDAYYEEERATEYKGICAEERNYSIGSWANDHYHQSYAVETAVHEPGADEPHEGFTNEELLNHQELSDKNLLFAEACGRGTRFCRPFTRANPPSNDTRVPPSIDIRSKPPSTVREKAKLDNNFLTRDEFGIFRDPESYARAIDGHALQVSREDITDILHATAQHSRAPAESCKQILQHSWSLKEISSELTIKGRYAEEAIDRCTPSAVDRYRRQASTIEDYDRSMYILYHRSASRRETHDLVPADFKPKASPNYKIIPDEFLT